MSHWFQNVYSKYPLNSAFCFDSNFFHKNSIHTIILLDWNQFVFWFWTKKENLYHIWTLPSFSTSEMSICFRQKCPSADNGVNYSLLSICFGGKTNWWFFWLHSVRKQEYFEDFILEIICWIEEFQLKLKVNIPFNSAYI